MLAALTLMIGGIACAQQPEKTDTTKQESPVVPSPAAEPATSEEQPMSPVTEEKTEQDGESKGDCTQSGGDVSSSTSDAAEPAK